MGPIALLGIIHGAAILFQLTFISISSPFSKKFSVSTKQADHKQTLSAPNTKNLPTLGVSNLKKFSIKL